MKIIFVCLSFIVFTSLSFAQTDSSISNVTTLDKEIFISGGVAFPYLPSEFKNYWKSGLNASAGFGFSFSPGDLGYSSVIAFVNYCNFDFNESKYRDAIKKTNPDTLISGKAAKSLLILVNYKGTFSTTKSSIAPYFLIGVGYIYYNADSVMVNHTKTLSPNDASTSEIAWTFGVGIEIPITKLIGGYVEAKSVLAAFDRPVQYFPVTAGIRFRF